MKRDTRRKRNTRRKGGVYLGEGVAGTVYKNPKEHPEYANNLEDEKTGEKCEWKEGYVIKIFGEEPDALKSSVRELRAAAALKHNKIEGVIYPERECRLPYKNPGSDQTFYKYVHILKDGGKSLEGMLDDGDLGKKKDFDPVFNALETLKKQVETMNKKNIFHDDIHAGNIVYKDGVANLIDFGHWGNKNTLESDVEALDNIIQELKETQGELEGGSKKSRRKAGKAKRRTRRRRSSQLG